MTELKLGVYRHFKGGEYRVTATAKHSETLEDLVVYEPLYDNSIAKVWVRPLDNFLGEKEVDGQKVKRFTFLRE